MAAVTNVSGVADGGTSLSRVQWMLLIGVVVVAVVLSRMLDSLLDGMPSAVSVMLGAAMVGLFIYTTLTLTERWNRR